jgi:ABC-type sugar transport system ATPase subunit
VAGYLKAPNKELQADGAYLCEVSIPNREIAAVYKNEILSHLLQIGAITRTTANKIAESFYHGLTLGLIALMDNQYKIKSNRESGDGRYDICLIPRDRKHPGIIMELKAENGLNEEELKALSAEALDQINDKRYDAEMRSDGVESILKIGIAFSGKKVNIKTE